MVYVCCGNSIFHNGKGRCDSPKYYICIDEGAFVLGEYRVTLGEVCRCIILNCFRLVLNLLIGNDFTYVNKWKEAFQLVKLPDPIKQYLADLFFVNKIATIWKKRAMGLYLRYLQSVMPLNSMLFLLPSAEY